MESTAYLIDTDAVFRLGLRRILETEIDIRVIGESPQINPALAEIEDNKPDIVIIDPGRQVYESFAEIRRFVADSPSTKVMLLSEQMNPATAKEALVLHLHAYAIKPISPTQVKEMFATLNQGRRYVAANYTTGRSSTLVPATDINCAIESDQSKLSDRETQILVRTVNGRTAADIAEEFDISIKTAEWHRRNVYSKLQVKNVAQLTKLALRVGIIALD